ncbi:MAG: FecR domain-containing protein [Pseudomonadota bacterium]
MVWLQRIVGVLLLGLCFAPASVFANAADVTFVYGTAYRVTQDGQRIKLAKGMSVETGDTVSTSVNGRVQLKMRDGGLLALKPNTDFEIEAFAYTPQTGAPATQPAEESKSFFVLLKGGFRSITGAVGRTDKSAYRVRTPVATIGIRGTDYSAQFCAADCDGNLPDGLSLSVLQGGVTLSNAAGALDIDAGGSGFVKDALTPPVQSKVTVAAATQSGGNQGATSSDDASDDAPAPTVATTTEEGVDLTGGGDPVSGSIAVAANQSVSVAGFADSATGEQAELFVDSNGNVTGLATTVNGTDANISINTAQNINLGADPTTGLRWGRWADGSAQIVFADGSQQALDLSDRSVHWVVGDVNQRRPTLPSSGTAAFSLVGNTNPTDNRGNVGVLGSANLSADFTNQTVDADVSLTIANENWDGAAQDVALDGNAAEFSGDFDTVTIQDATGERQGTGSLAGFFTGDENGTVDGAGLGYSLSDDAGVDVSGTAVFQATDGNP